VATTQVPQRGVLETVETKQSAAGKSGGRNRRVEKDIQNQYAGKENTEVLEGQVAS